MAALRLVGDEEGDISAHEIEEFIVKKGLIDGQTISRYLEIILDGKQTAAGCLKQLIFLHRYLQASKSIDQTLLLAFINKILRFV